MGSPFREFPKRPPARILIYGDPGTEKTRRAMQQMPGPVAFIDLEAGAAYYSDIAPPGSVYLSTRSVRDVEDALTWLESREAAGIATVIVDPITVVWEQLQEGHRVRMVQRRKFNSPEEVLFDVGTWGRLGAVHGSIITRLCNLRQHVVCIGRGKEGIDDKGNKTGYQFTGQKNTPSLMSTVIEAHAGAPDVVIKDRSGAYREGRATGRVDFRAIVGASGDAVTRMQTDTEAAERDASSTGRQAPQIAERPGDAEPTPQQVKCRDALVAAGIFDAVAQRIGDDLVTWTREDLTVASKALAEHRAVMDARADANAAKADDKPRTTGDLFNDRRRKRIAECIAAGVMDATIEKHGDPDRWTHETLTTIKAELAALAEVSA